MESDRGHQLEHVTVVLGPGLELLMRQELHHPLPTMLSTRPLQKGDGSCLILHLPAFHQKHTGELGIDIARPNRYVELIPEQLESGRIDNLLVLNFLQELGDYHTNSFGLRCPRGFLLDGLDFTGLTWL